MECPMFGWGVGSGSCRLSARRSGYAGRGKPGSARGARVIAGKFALTADRGRFVLRIRMEIGVALQHASPDRRRLDPNADILGLGEMRKQPFVGNAFRIDVPKKGAVFLNDEQLSLGKSKLPASGRMRDGQ